MESFLPAELELQRRAPRNAINRAGKFGDIKPFLIFLVPHVWIAAVAPFVLGYYIYNFCAAEPFEGTILSHSTYHNSKGSPVRYLEGEFKVDGKSYRTQYSVEDSLYESVKDGDKVKVLALRSNPAASSHLDGDNSSIAALLFGTLWVAVWCTGTFAFLHFVLAQPLRSKKLVKNGTAVQGKLDELKITSGRNGNAYFALYSFPYRRLDPKTGRMEMATIKGKMKVSQANYAAAESNVGKNVTVLVDEKNPGCNIVYRYCDHEAVN